MNPAIAELLQEQDRQERMQASVEKKPTPAEPKVITETAEAKAERERVEQFVAEREAAIPVYIKTLLAIEKKSGLTVHEFFSALIVISQGDAVMRAALERGERTTEVDVNHPAMPIHLKPPQDEPIQPTEAS